MRMDSYTYTAPRHFKGTVKFSYAASDGASESEIAMVYIKFGRKHRSPHKVSKGNDLDDLDPRHPASHHRARVSKRPREYFSRSSAGPAGIR